MRTRQQEGIFILHASFSFLPGQLSLHFLSFFVAFPFFNFGIVPFLSSKTIFRFFIVVYFPCVILIPYVTNGGFSSVSLSLQRGTGLCFVKNTAKGIIQKYTAAPLFSILDLLFPEAKLLSIILIPNNAHDRVNTCARRDCVFYKNTLLILKSFVSYVNDKENN